MDLTPTEEQRLLRESAERFVRETYDADHHRRVAASADGFSREVWTSFRDLGWLALPLPEAYGGLGGGAVEVGIVAEALGRGLASEPYLSTVVLGAGLVALAGAEEQKKAILPRVAEGETLLALAHAERQARGHFDDVATTAVRDGDGWRLDGAKIAVADAPSADLLIVSARLRGERRSPEGLGLFLVDPKAAGLTVRAYSRLGGGKAANLDLAGVRVGADALLGGNDDVFAALEAVIDRAVAALAAESVGIMSVLLDTTSAYTRTREQFGRPLSANQAVRHRLADMAIACEEARSMALRAALFADAERAERIRAVSGARAKVGRAARFVAEQSVQLHGGMGVTEELEIGRYFQRVLAIEALFGSIDQHLRRYGLASAGNLKTAA